MRVGKAWFRGWRAQSVREQRRDGRCKSIPGNNREISGEKRSGRSRITNRSKLLPGIDGRSPWVRRCKDIIAAHLSDLGGADNTSAAERSTIRRAAVLTTELERFEVKFASAGEASTEDLDA